MFIDDLQVRIRQQLFNDYFDIYIYANREKGAVLLSWENDGWTYKPLGNGAIYPAPSITLPRQALKGLVDKIAELGILPDKAKELTSVLDEKDKHLQDMRRLVFKDKQGGEGK